MRLWSIHPKYLDKYGLIALWREGLLAQKALLGEAPGYQNNPQLIRFKSQANPLKAIGCYLSFIASEALSQGYKFNHEKILFPNFEDHTMRVEPSVVALETHELKTRLKARNPIKFKQLEHLQKVETNPIFNIE